MDAERIVVVAVVVVVGIILAATCDYLLCGLLYGERNDESQALEEIREREDAKREAQAIIREIEQVIREIEAINREPQAIRELRARREFFDKLNEFHRSEKIKLSWLRGKELNLSTYQKIKLF